MKTVSVDVTIGKRHSLMNDVVTDTAAELSGGIFIVKLDDLLKDRGLSQKDLASMTGIRVGTISEWVNGKNMSISKVQLLAIMAALRVTSITDIFELKLPAKAERTFKEEAKQWTATKHMPEAVKDLYRENVLKSAGLQ